MGKNSKSDTVATSVLENLGFSVHKLPETSLLGKRADFIAELGALKLLVEAKLRKDDPEELARIDKEEVATGKRTSSHDMGKNNALTKNIREAVKQLNAEREEAHDFKVLMYLADCENASAVFEQIVDTLYGKTTVLHSRRDRLGIREIPCYFYRENEFHPAKSLDAAIIGFKSGVQWVVTLCLNPFADRIKEVRSSVLPILFEGRTIDPVAEEAKGAALIPDHDAPRPSGKSKEFERMFSIADGMLRHLEKKYGYEPQALFQGHFTRQRISHPRES